MECGMSRPKILLLDIETAPDLVWIWRVYDSNAIEVERHWYVLSFAYRWLDGPVVVRGLDDCAGYGGGKVRIGDDKRLVTEVHGLLSEADIVVAHNGGNFDIRKLNARFIAHGMKPPAPYKVVDTKAELSRIAAFSSNKLDWLAAQLELGRKLEHQGFPMWKGCMNGDKKSWARMKKYNAHDITLLNKLYDKIAPWIAQPNAIMWGMECPNPRCKKPQIQSRGLSMTKTRLYRRFQCVGCGKWLRSVVSEKERKARFAPID